MITLFFHNDGRFCDLPLDFSYADVYWMLVERKTGMLIIGIPFIVDVFYKNALIRRNVKFNSISKLHVYCVNIA